MVKFDTRLKLKFNNDWSQPFEHIKKAMTRNFKVSRVQDREYYTTGRKKPMRVHLLGLKLSEFTSLEFVRILRTGNELHG